MTYWHALAALGGLIAYFVALVAWAHHHDRRGH